jgi:hypothetical protein
MVSALSPCAAVKFLPTDAQTVGAPPATWFESLIVREFQLLFEEFYVKRFTLM